MVVATISLAKVEVTFSNTGNSHVGSGGVAAVLSYGAKALNQVLFLCQQQTSNDGSIDNAFIVLTFRNGGNVTSCVKFFNTKPSRQSEMYADVVQWPILVTEVMVELLKLKQNQ